MNFRENGNMICVMYQELHSQVFLFNRFMGELLAAAAPLVFDDIGIRVAVVHDLVHLAGARVPEHEHPVYELAWIRSGAMTYVIDEVRMENTGENFRMVLIPPSTLHYRFSMEEVSVIRSAELQFSPHSSQAAQLLAALPERIRECGFALSPSPGAHQRNGRPAGFHPAVGSGRAPVQPDFPGRNRHDAECVYHLPPPGQCRTDAARRRDGRRSRQNTRLQFPKLLHRLFQEASRHDSPKVSGNV